MNEYKVNGLLMAIYISAVNCASTSHTLHVLHYRKTGMECHIVHLTLWSIYHDNL